MQAITLVALLTVAIAGIAMTTVEDAPVGWPLLALAFNPLLAAFLIVTRHRYSEGFLRLTAMVWVPLGLFVPIMLVLGAVAEPQPGWLVPALVLGSIAAVSSVVALAAGLRFLRTAGGRA